MAKTSFVVTWVIVYYEDRKRINSVVSKENGIFSKTLSVSLDVSFVMRAYGCDLSSHNTGYIPYFRTLSLPAGTLTGFHIFS